VEQGLGGATPALLQAFSAMGHRYFDSVEAFQAAFGPHAGEIMRDIANYTNVQPTIQVSEVKGLVRFHGRLFHSRGLTRDCSGPELAVRLNG